VTLTWETGTQVTLTRETGTQVTSNQVTKTQVTKKYNKAEFEKAIKDLKEVK
jgi:hypothetical protein